VFPLEWHDPKSGEVSSGYRERGYLPEAVINFLALLGWNPGDDEELLSMQQLIDKFDLAKCSKNGARFDYVKGFWFNREYLMRLSDAEMAPAFVELLARQGISTTPERAADVIGMMKSKVIEYQTKDGPRKRNISFVSDLWPLCRFFFVAPTSFNRDDKFVRKNWTEASASEMGQLRTQLAMVDDFTADGIKASIDPWVEQTGLKPWNAWRVCLVGEGQGPDMYALAAFLGKDETLRRMDFAIATL
jgi:glutamyl-tRNA synthetase